MRVLVGLGSCVGQKLVKSENDLDLLYPRLQLWSPGITVG